MATPFETTCVKVPLPVPPPEEGPPANRVKNLMTCSEMTPPAVRKKLIMIFWETMSVVRRTIMMTVMRRRTIVRILVRRKVMTLRMMTMTMIGGCKK